MAHVVQIGGGNIGSHLAPHLARMPEINAVTLVDRDRYDLGNLSGQDILPRDVGRPKARLLAARLRRIRPGLRVEAIVGPVEEIPLGRLRGDLILACLDSRWARQSVNQAAWRLGVPWIDSGIEAGGMLARVNGYWPGHERPCLECAWEDQDYELLETPYACRQGQQEAGSGFATNAPSCLGALAASLQAVECRRYLADPAGPAEQGNENLFNRQLVLDATTHKMYVSSLRRNPRCRFDHASRPIEDLDRSAGWTLEGMLRLPGGAPIESAYLRVEGRMFVQALRCAGCGHGRSKVKLESSLRLSERTCTLCGGVMAASGWDRIERLTAGLPRADLRRSPASLGIGRHELVIVGNNTRERYLMIA